MMSRIDSFNPQNHKPHIGELGRPKKVNLIDSASLDRLNSKDHLVSREGSPVHSRQSSRAPSLTPNQADNQIYKNQEHGSHSSHSFTFFHIHFTKIDLQVPAV